VAPTAHLVVDDTTRRNLELERTLSGGERRGTPARAARPRRHGDGLAAAARVAGAAAARRPPSRARQAAVGDLVAEAPMREALRAGLREVADVERLVARVSQGTGHARDLGALRRSLEALPAALAAIAGRPALAGPGCRRTLR
jgi:DNA mismatch repair protein MutS